MLTTFKQYMIHTCSTHKPTHKHTHTRTYIHTCARVIAGYLELSKKPYLPKDEELQCKSTDWDTPHLDEVDKLVVDVGSLGQEETAARTELMEEVQLLTGKNRQAPCLLHSTGNSSHGQLHHLTHAQLNTHPPTYVQYNPKPLP